MPELDVHGRTADQRDTMASNKKHVTMKQIQQYTLYINTTDVEKKTYENLVGV